MIVIYVMSLGGLIIIESSVSASDTEFPRNDKLKDTLGARDSPFPRKAIYKRLGGMRVGAVREPPLLPIKKGCFFMYTSRVSAWPSAR